MSEAMRKEAGLWGQDISIMESFWPTEQAFAVGLIDEYHFVLVPVIIGKGRNLFNGIENPPALELKETRSFKNGNSLLIYKKARATS